jgi:hypothetical protein
MDSDPVANSDSGPDVAKRVCPQCGTELGDARPAKMDCPNCGQQLRLAGGGAWHLADEAELEGPPGPERDRRHEEEALDEALAESFPASDPPAFP